MLAPICMIVHILSSSLSTIVSFIFRTLFCYFGFRVIEKKENLQNISLPVFPYIKRQNCIHEKEMDVQLLTNHEILLFLMFLSTLIYVWNFFIRLFLLFFRLYLIRYTSFHFWSLNTWPLNAFPHWLLGHCIFWNVVLWIEHSICCDTLPPHPQENIVTFCLPILWK